MIENFKNKKIDKIEEKKEEIQKQESVKEFKSVSDSIAFSDDSN